MSFPYTNLFNININSGIKFLPCITYEHPTIFSDVKKFKDLLQILLKINPEFFSKIRNILTKNYFDFTANIKDSLTNLIYKKSAQNNSFSIENLVIVSVEDTDKLDLIFLLIFSKIITVLRENLINFEKFFITELEVYLSTLSSQDEKKKENIWNNYSDEFSQIKIIINTELLKILQTIVLKNFNNALNYTNLDLFLENYFTVYHISNSAIKLDNSSSNFANIFNKVQVEYITNYFQIKEKKMRESVDCEDWQALKYVPSNYQNMVSFMGSCNISEMRGSDSNKNDITDKFSILKIFEKNEIMQEFIENEKEPTDINTELASTILIDSNINNTKSSFKMVISSLEIIKVTYDSLKLISVFERSLSHVICQNLGKYLNNFILSMKVLILDGEALQKGRLQKLSQTEVAITNANASIIKNIIMNIINNNSSTSPTKEKTSDIINPVAFDELLTNLDKIRHTCRYNISNMLNDSIRDSIAALSSLDFGNYPISSEDDKSINKFVKIYHKFNPVYASMINSFEESEIVSTFQENLKIFFDKLESTIKTLNDKQKMTDPNQIKQFKRDMSAVKKNLKTFKILSKDNLLDSLQERVDSITKIVVPKMATRKK